ncbi:MAG: hypothetical protein PWP23_2429 [Candidatus Sumerlaeota bacterium]|nr:hypothetical protein [Candidatus Sumerlaeota bacterium]
MWTSPDFLIRWTLEHKRLARQVLRGIRPSAESAWSRPPRAGAPWPLVLYSQVAWDDVWQRPQELARGMAAHRPVLFVSPVQVHQTAGPLNGRCETVRVECGGRLTILSPLLLTGEYRGSAIRALNRAILARALRPFVHGRPFVFLSNSPFVDDLQATLRPALTGYDIIDDFCAFEWAPASARRRERRLLARCDFATAGTWALHRKYQRSAPGMEYLPSGVDFPKLTRPAPEPASLADLPHPRFLYVGTLNDRLDGALFDRVARAFPEATIVVVGPRRQTFSAPAFPSNVVELGLKPHDELPGFYQHCDLGLMPFADNDAARAINPVKTLEYLSAGLPVISTPIPDVKRFYVPPVVIARPDEWPAQIRRMLAEDTPELRAERRAFASGHSWESLVQRMENRIRALEEKRRGAR